jgi:hypothetical protein
MVQTFQLKSAKDLKPTVFNTQRPILNIHNLSPVHTTKKDHFQIFRLKNVLLIDF